jgi:hypothetical protein
VRDQQQPDSELHVWEQQLYVDFRWDVGFRWWDPQHGRARHDWHWQQRDRALQLYVDPRGRDLRQHGVQPACQQDHDGEQHLHGDLCGGELGLPGPPLG